MRGVNEAVPAMAVFVDNASIPFGRMRMCHMLAESTSELLAMADRIGVARKWIQAAGTYREHFDVCASKRAVAIRYGAREVTGRRIVLIFRYRRRSGDYQR